MPASAPARLPAAAAPAGGALEADVSRAPASSIHRAAAQGGSDLPRSRVPPGRRTARAELGSCPRSANVRRGPRHRDSSPAARSDDHRAIGDLPRRHRTRCRRLRPRQPSGRRWRRAFLPQPRAPVQVASRHVCVAVTDPRPASAVTREPAGTSQRREACSTPASRQRAASRLISLHQVKAIWIVPCAHAPTSLTAVAHRGSELVVWRGFAGQAPAYESCRFDMRPGYRPTRGAAARRAVIQHATRAPRAASRGRWHGRRRQHPHGDVRVAMLVG